MKIRALLFKAAVFLFAVALPAGQETAGSRPLVLTGVTVIDGLGGPPVEGRTLIVAGGRITDIYPDGAGTAPRGAEELDFRGCAVIPGLIESHFHMAGCSEDRLAWAMEGGVSVLREMAGDGGYLRELQKAIEQGAIPGPDLYFSAVMGGPELIQNDSRVRAATPPSYALGSAPWARQVDETTDIPAVVREARACGASALKLYADLTPVLVRRLTEEGHRQGLKVWAHSFISPAGPEDILAAGVDSVSHASGFLLPPDWKFRRDSALAFDPQMLERERMSRLAAIMIKRGIFLDATLSVLADSLDRTIGDPGERHRLESLAAAPVRAFHQAGVQIVAGTDCFLPRIKGEPPAVHREMRLLVEEGGLTPLEAITAATWNGARLLGLDRELGSIEIGKRADLVVLRKDPSQNIANTTSIALVIEKGRIVFRRGTPAAATSRFPLRLPVEKSREKFG